MSMEDKVEGYRRKLEKYEKVREAEARQISIKDILSKKILDVYLPDYGGYIRVAKLTYTELLDLRNQAKSNDELNYLIVWKAINKVDPSITIDDVREMPVDAFTAILMRIVTPFQRLGALLEEAGKLNS
ncbi:MAG: hypothetical protein QW374_04955 [Candidatus Bathyarchaeia archaeon]|nr:hypothetical protein [Candidatus Bathyarchaeota archaeon]